MENKEKIKNKIIELYNYRNTDSPEKIDLSKPAVEIENTFFKEYKAELKKAEKNVAGKESEDLSEMDFSGIENIN